MRYWHLFLEVYVSLFRVQVPGNETTNKVVEKEWCEIMYKILLRERNLGVNF